MNVLFTSSEAPTQIASLSRIEESIAVVFLDKPYDLQVSDSSLDIWQDSRHVTATRESSAIFLLFREPHESTSDPLERLAALENFEILGDACEIVGINTYNAPKHWQRAYRKTALLEISMRFPGLVPPARLVSGTHFAASGASHADQIVKSGFGVHRPINKLYPHAALIPAGEVFAPSVDYRYVLQDFVCAERELRAYFTYGPAGNCISVFEMPVGSVQSPDWRDTTPVESFTCCRVEDDCAGEIAQRIAAEFKLGFVVLDLLREGENTYLIDLNPHGSWAWLPSPACDYVDRQVESWIASIVETGSK